MNKVDRALEIQVIDWLQWCDFPYYSNNPNMPELALEFMSKRKKYTKKLEDDIEKSKEVLISLKSSLVNNRMSLNLEFTRQHMVAEIDFLLGALNNESTQSPSL